MADKVKDKLGRMKELVDVLNRNITLYYDENTTVISDAEFDALYDELRRLEDEEGYSLKDSPTKRVGVTPQNKFEQSKHLNRLYSLDKCQSFSEFEEWCARLVKTVGYLPELTAEYKFDGLTLNLLYENGELVKATTRGDGTTGEVVTAQVKTARKLPHTINFEGKIEIQGEGVLRLSQFDRYNETAAEPLKNARNGVAGAIRNLNPAVTAERGISFFAYNLGYSDKQFESQAEIRDFLIGEGFETEGKFRHIKTASDAKNYIDEAETARANLDYLIDGLVFKVNDLRLRDEIGYTEKFPKWAVAYKFKADEMTTVLKDVIWQVSRSGKLNPLAVLEPVDIGGVTVRRATLNNYGDIVRKKVRIGDRVFIRRSNDVIPEIMGVAESNPDSLEIEKPAVCPSCGSPVKEVGALLYCGGEQCAPKDIALLDHFASKDALDIEGFSEKTAEQLFNEIGMKTPVDLMRLKAEDIVGLDGFGEKKTANLITSIAKSKHTTADRFLYALAIDGIGKKTARDLVKRFKSIDRIAAADYDELISIDGVGGILANNIVSYFSDSSNERYIAELYESGIIVEEEKEKKGVFSGLKFVLTGSLPTLKRGEATSIIEDNGGEVVSSVSKNVDIVLVGEDAGSKLEKAKKLGLRIITEDEFKALL